MNYFIHLVDHNPSIAIMPLLAPLTKLSNHEIMTSFPGEREFSESRVADILKMPGIQQVNVILHSSGKDLPFFLRAEPLFAKLAGKGLKTFVLMHLSPECLRMRGRHDCFSRLKTLQHLFSTTVLTPGVELARLYRHLGFNALPVQFGVDGPCELRPYEECVPYRRFIVTCCTKSTADYQTIKGIDRFIQVVTANGVQGNAFIVGHDGHEIDGIVRKRLSMSELGSLLEKSLVYVQLSRVEAYNLTAVYAKRMKVPVIVSNVEGHRDNVRYGFRVDSIEEAVQQLGLILREPMSDFVKHSVEANWADTMTRETVEAFAASLESAVTTSSDAADISVPQEVE